MIQEEYIGSGSISRLGEFLKIASNVFLVTGKESYTSSGAAALLSPLLQSCHVTHFHDFSAYPKLEDLRRGLSAIRGISFDCIIAVGGGSVIDMAKLLKCFWRQEGFLEELIRTGRHSTPPAIPLAAIPTTSGSGSEATHFAVVYMGREKFSVADESLLPNLAIVDPRLTSSLPPRLTAITGMDALSQAIESYWSVNSTEESRRYSAEAITTVMSNLYGTVNAPTDALRERMSYAAHMAGKAINITKTTAPHAISYALTSCFGVPHGLAVALTLGEIFAFNAGVNDSDVVDPRGVAHVRSIMADLTTLLGCKDAGESVRKLTGLIQSVGLETRLTEVGVRTEADISLVVNSVNLERLRNNPRRLSSKTLREMLQRLS